MARMAFSASPRRVKDTNPKPRHLPSSVLGTATLHTNAAAENAFWICSSVA
jgi:hypothetical protein